MHFCILTEYAVSARVSVPKLYDGLCRDVPTANKCSG
jgi:hypothetical protein